MSSSKKVAGKSRKFNFTLNNYTDEHIAALGDLQARYLCYGKELAPSTGTRHLQGFVYFANPRSFASVCALLPRGVHLDISNGTPQQNKAYCEKDGDFHEQGELPVDAQQKGVLAAEQWTEIVALARLGQFEQIYLKYPSQYGTRLKQLEYLHSKRPRDVRTLEGEGPFHEWIVGPTGVGKSRDARERHPGAYIKEPECRWWDGYDDEDVVIIEDFDKFQVAQGGAMKRWLDRYPFQAEVKGGMVQIRPKKVVVTSQYYPREIWEDQKTVDAIMRRVKLIDVSPFPEPIIPAMFVRTFNPPPK